MEKITKDVYLRIGAYLIEFLFFMYLLKVYKDPLYSSVFLIAVMTIVVVGTRTFGRIAGDSDKKSIIVWFFLKLLFSITCVIGNMLSEGIKITRGIIIFLGIFFLVDALVGICCVIYLRIKNFVIRNWSFDIYRTFIAMVIINGILLAVCYPCLITFDTNTQMLMAEGKISLSDHHPVLLTFLIAFFMKLGRIIGNVNIGMFLFALVQVIFWSAACTYAVWIVYNVVSNKILCSAIRIIYLINPMLCIYSITVGKDSSAAILLLVYCCSVIEALYIKNTVSVRLFFQLVITATLASLIRHNALYVFMVAIPLLLLVFKKRIVILMYVLFICSIVGTHFTYYEVLGIERTSDAEKYSVMIQTTANMLCHHKDELSENELNTIKSFMGEADDIIAAYDPQISDPIKNSLYNENISKEQKKAFFRQWIQLFFKYPKSYISGVVKQTYGYFYIGYCKDVKPRYFIKYTKRFSDSRSEAGFRVGHRYALKVIGKCVRILQKIPVLGLFMQIGLYTWLLVYSIACGIRHKNVKNLIVQMPLILYFITILLGPANGYYRYMIPVIICVPLIVAINQQPLLCYRKLFEER